MNPQTYIDDSLLQLRKLKTKADRSVAQVGDEHFFTTLDPESNSIALIIKHLSGNMRSRWTDFLITDGEKPDRNRDNEFERSGKDTRDSILTSWEEGWSRAISAISALKPEDLDRTIEIRGEPHTVLQAINRQLAHYAAHVGQIIFLAKHYAGGNWQSLSIPRGKSKEYDESKSGEQNKPQ